MNWSNMFNSNRKTIFGHLNNSSQEGSTIITNNRRDFDDDIKYSITSLVDYVGTHPIKSMINGQYKGRPF